MNTGVRQKDITRGVNFPETGGNIPAVGVGDLLLWRNLDCLIKLERHVTSCILRSQIMFAPGSLRLPNLRGRIQSCILYSGTTIKLLVKPGAIISSFQGQTLLFSSVKSIAGG